MASTIKVDKLEGSTGSTITVPTGQTLTLTDGLGVSSLPTVTVAKGGTNLTSFAAGDLLYATGSTTLAKLTKGTAEQVLAMNSGATAPDWGSVDLTVLPTITVAKGGTNLSSFTAGDVLYATGATTLAKLAKGSAADVLTMNAGATAPEWAASAGGGKVLQVVTATDSTERSTSSTSWATGSNTLSAAITPSATSSKILILTNYTTTSTSDWTAGTVYRDGSTNLGDATYGFGRTKSNNYYSYISTAYLDSPSSTSSLTYQVYFKGGSGTSYLQKYGSMSTITVMEIGA